jgi:hypothetical protein
MEILGSLRRLSAPQANDPASSEKTLKTKNLWWERSGMAAPQTVFFECITGIF